MSMIGQIKGILDTVEIDHVIVDVGGIGYQIGLPTNTMSKLPAVGKEIKFYTYQVIKEDGHYLYGFLSREEKNLFKLLLTVNGVGPKSALSIIGSFELNNLVGAITKGNAAYLSSVPGIGSKTAQKVILDLKEKVSKAYGAATSEITQGLTGDTPLVNDAMSALLSLGYSPKEAKQALSKADLSGNQTIEQVLKSVLSKIV
jgi:Holliday junction DNA helicase RuvA